MTEIAVAAVNTTETTEYDTVVKRRVKCLRCGYVWIPHVEHPVECSKCKSLVWNKPKLELKMKIGEKKA